MVSTPLKNISQLGWFFPIYWKIKNVPNHQPDIKMFVVFRVYVLCKKGIVFLGLPKSCKTASFQHVIDDCLIVFPVAQSPGSKFTDLCTCPRWKETPTQHLRWSNRAIEKWPWPYPLVNVLHNYGTSTIFNGKINYKLPILPSGVIKNGPIMKV